MSSLQTLDLALELVGSCLRDMAATPQLQGRALEGVGKVVSASDDCVRKVALVRWFQAIQAEVQEH